MVTAMLNNSITVATPIKMSRVFSMLAPVRRELLRGAKKFECGTS